MEREYECMTGGDVDNYSHREWADCRICGEETTDECPGCQEHVCAPHQLLKQVHFDPYETGKYYQVARCEECAWFELMPETDFGVMALLNRVQYWVEQSDWDQTCALVWRTTTLHQEAA